MTNKMNMVTSAALFFLAAGIFTSVSILSAYQILFTLSVIYFTYIAFKDKNLQLPKSAYWLMAFTLVALLSLVINFDLIPKPSKNFGRLKYFIYGVGGIFVLRYWLKGTSDKVKKIVSHTFLYAIAIAGAYASIKFLISNEDRARGFTDTLRYGYGSSMVLLILLGTILHRAKMGNWFNVRLATVAFILGFIGLYFTFEWVSLIWR
jgi:hypothetical protein